MKPTTNRRTERECEPPECFNQRYISFKHFLTEIQAGNNKFSSYARTSLTVESLSQARARATKPEPLSQSHRARAGEPVLPSQSQSQQIHTFDVKRNSSTAIKF